MTITSRSFAWLRTTGWHPRQRTLAAFALGDLEARARVARHLEGCSDCRQFVGFTQRLSGAVSGLPAPVPDEDILARALADRASGRHVILPGVVDAHPVSSPRVLWRNLAIAAASIVVAIALLSQFRGRDFRGANELLLAGLAPRRAEAGQGGTAGGPLTHRLRAINTTFRRRIIDSASGRAKEWGALEVRVAPLSGERWLITSAWRELDSVTDMQNARAWTESVTVADSSLAPIRRIAHVTPYRRWAGISIDQSFRNDSVVGQMSLDQDATRRPIAQDLRSARDRVIASDALAPFWLMGVPLVQGMEIDASMLGWAVVPSDVLVGMHLKVVGSERMETPAGTFDCWKLSISVGPETHYHWVRKSDHLGVLTRRRLPNGDTREIILTHEGSDR
jgi:hypothetical protein